MGDVRLILLITGLLLLAGIVLNKPSKRFGIPGLLLYLGLGMAIGNGGKYDFLYNYPQLTLHFSQVAIGLIVFIGGLETRIERFKPIIKEGISLSTLGVLVCSVVTGLFGWFVFRLEWLEAWLLGAIISSTDAAAVFSILNANKLKLKNHLAELLEFESGTNDPMAWFLTLSLTSLLTGHSVGFWNIVFDFFAGIAIGLILGLGFGRLGIYISRNLKLDIKGLYPLILLSIALVVMGASSLLYGNMLLAMYVSGIVLGNTKLPFQSYSINFFESISWLLEISLFIILGLEVFPKQMLPYLFPAVLMAVFLMFVARPLSVWVSLTPFGRSNPDKLYVSWVGLRGATPIVFSLIPLTAGVGNSEVIFNSVFVIVIFSVILQGTGVVWMARLLKRVDDH
ncbi:MAG: potassium/proton antiporter [Salibacteraceae bacterium]